MILHGLNSVCSHRFGKGFFCLAVLTLALCFSLPALAVTFAEKPYSASIILKEVGHKPKECGKVKVAGSKARLDVNLGVTGVFSAILLSDEKTLIVFSDALRGYVTLPLTGEERDLREITAQAARGILPASVGAIEIQEGPRKNLGTKDWQGWKASVSQSRFVARMMGNDAAITLELWESSALAPFPLRVVNLGGDEGQNGDSVELANIKQGFTPTENDFVIPDGYSRYTSVFNLLLYAITGF